MEHASYSTNELRIRFTNKSPNWKMAFLKKNLKVKLNCEEKEKVNSQKRLQIAHLL